MEDRFHDSGRPHHLPEGTLCHDFADTRLLPYRGCTRRAPRTGTARTAPAWILRAAAHHSHTALAPIRLELGDTPWAGVPCWSGGAQQWATITVPAAYTARYETHVRPVMPGNPISLRALIRVAEARAAAADYGTGRNCRPTNDRLAAETGYSIRTVQRASTALRLLGVSTEILRGRQRTRAERLASWRVGDRGRGWASVWVLHDNRFRQLSPHPVGSLFNQKPLTKKKLTTTNRRIRSGHRAATRHANLEPGTRLAQRWIIDPHSPTWARRYRTSRPWAQILNAAAEHGWTPRDVNQLITDYVGAGHWVPNCPYKPAGLLGAILRWHPDLHDRPAAADEAREAQELAAARARIRQQLDERKANRLARAMGKAALNGPGHAAARQALHTALARRRSRYEPDEQVFPGSSPATTTGSRFG